MDCHALHALLDGYVDGELDLSHNLEIEQHLLDCPACAGAVQGRQALRESLQTAGLRFHPAASLGQRVRAALRDAVPDRPAPPSRPRRWRQLAVTSSWALAGALAAGALVAVSVWALSHLPRGPAASDRLAGEVVASHIHSLMADHLLDVKSSDRHEVKPWFIDQAKLDYSPPVRDLDKQGFKLKGGRIDYLDHRPVAAVVYQRRKHRINLFVWPASSGTSAEVREEERQGFRLIHWTEGGMTYWAVSDLNGEELREFVREVRAAAQPAAGQE
jgi:anti-sigma factor RsiW